MLNFEVYGVVEFMSDLCVILIEEKFIVLKGCYVILGFYFYCVDVVDVVCVICLSVCGELEIIVINDYFFCEGCL